MNNYNNPNPQNNPQYGQPAAPQYPQQPQQYAQPAQPQQYAQQPQQYAQPAQPQYGQPAAPTYAAPAAPAYTAPAAPVAAPAKAGNPVLVPFLVSLISSIMMVISLFMPYADLSGFGMDFSFSLMDLAMGADSVSAVMGNGATDGFIVFILILLVFFGLTILFAALKKPIPQMIFAIISLIIMMALSGVVSGLTGGEFPFGFGVYFFYIMAIGSIVGSILMIIAKKKAAAAAAPAPAMPY